MPIASSAKKIPTPPPLFFMVPIIGMCLFVRIIKGAALLNAEVVATTPTPTPGLELGGGMPVAGFAFGSDTKEVANVKG